MRVCTCHFCNVLTHLRIPVHTTLSFVTHSEAFLSYVIGASMLQICHPLSKTGYKAPNAYGAKAIFEDET
eukprot:145096-Prorocentrum_minimum.AAC.3